MKKIYGVPLGRLAETIATLEHPERTAKKSGPGVFADYTLQVWPNRESMVRSIRMQERRAASPYDWKAILPLSTGEGY